MTKLITIRISGIKCDNEACDYMDAEVDRDNYPKYIDKPCPECGSNLLTKEDYDAVVELEGITTELNIDIPEDLLGDEVVLQVGMDGTGSFNLIEKEEE